MPEESLKKELRAALSPRRGRQPRNLLSADPMEPKKSPPPAKPGLLSRLFRRH
jgi:hypothetical protein